MVIFSSTDFSKHIDGADADGKSNIQAIRFASIAYYKQHREHLDTVIFDENSKNSLQSKQYSEKKN